MGNIGEMIKKDKLATSIESHRKLYSKGQAIIEDAQFDALCEELHSIDPDHPALRAIGHAHSRAKTPHTTPMLSLDKTKSLKDVEIWAMDINGPILVMPKYDGVAISAHYEGKLVRAVTRGDGKVGDDITHIAKFILPPKVLIRSTKPLELRGEVLFTREVWEEIEHVFVKRAKGKGTVNPRNAAAGSLLRKSVTQEAKALSFVCYDILGTSASSLVEALNVLPDEVLPECVMCLQGALPAGIEGLLATVQKPAFPFETDGLVLKADSFPTRERLGATSHHPRWALALKHEDKPAETTIKDVHWQVSRTGTITPVAIVTPVVVGGVTVSRATLHHAQHMKDLRLVRGSRISMTRRGGVIPHVEKVIFSPKDGIKLLPPVACPCCQSDILFDNDFIKCAEADTCPDVQRAKLVYWCAQTDMMGFGEKVIHDLYNDGMVIQPSELYTMSPDVMIEMFGKGLGPKLVKEAKAKSILTPAQVLNAIGIEGIGKTQSEKLFEVFTLEELIQISKSSSDKRRHPNFLPEGFGPTLAENLFEGIKENAGILENLLKVITLKEPSKSTVTVGPFVGKKVVFTGKLSDMERETALEQVRMFGGITPGSVTKDTHYLVVGDNASPEQLHKRTKAIDYNAKGGQITIITETRFMELLQEAIEQGGL